MAELLEPIAGVLDPQVVTSQAAQIAGWILELEAMDPDVQAGQWAVISQLANGHPAPDFWSQVYDFLAAANDMRQPSSAETSVAAADDEADDLLASAPESDERPPHIKGHRIGAMSSRKLIAMLGNLGCKVHVANGSSHVSIQSPTGMRTIISLNEGQGGEMGHVPISRALSRLGLRGSHVSL